MDFQNKLQKCYIDFACFICTRAYNNNDVRIIQWECEHYTCEDCFNRIRRTLSAICPFCRSESVTYAVNDVQGILVNEEALNQLIRRLLRRMKYYRRQLYKK